MNINNSQYLLNRRNFLKLSGALVATLAINPTSAFSFQREYNYGLDYLRDKDLEFIIDSDTGLLFSENFFEFNPNSNTGLCRELMCNEFLEVKDKRYAFRCIGQEPNYFSGGNSEHFFLLTFDENPDSSLLNPIYDSDTINRLLSLNPMVEDPSFNLKRPYLGSGYEVTTMIPLNVECSYKKDLLLENGESLILDEGRGHLVSAIFNVSNPDLFTLRLDKRLSGEVYTQEHDLDYINENVTSLGRELYDKVRAASVEYSSIPSVTNFYVD